MTIRSRQCYEAASTTAVRAGRDRGDHVTTRTRGGTSHTKSRRPRDNPVVTEPLTFASTPELTGATVVLRPLGPEHVDGLMASLADPELLRLTGTHTVFSRAQIEQHCATRSAHHDRLDYAVLERESGRFIGDLAITDLDADNRSCGFRIALLAKEAGRGFGTEATRLIVDHLFAVGVHRIGLEVFAFNPRARRVYEKVGFVLEGTMRDALLWDGQWVDAELMAILATDPRGVPKGAGGAR